MPEKPEYFFLELNSFKHKAIFDGAEEPWSVLAKIRPYISDYISRQTPTDKLPAGLEIMKDPAYNEQFIFCHRPVLFENDYCNHELQIFVGKGSRMEPTAMLKPNAIIGADCDMRHGVYLRGDIITGDSCTLGHATEIKGSIIMNHSEMGHFNYIGDTVIGSYVNLGAGTKVANLKFRTPEMKKNLKFPEIKFIYSGNEVATGISKFGAIIGDHCETGCNSVLAPAILFGPECWVYPNFTAPSGIYEAKSFLAPEKLKVKRRPLPR